MQIAIIYFLSGIILALICGAVCRDRSHREEVWLLKRRIERANKFIDSTMTESVRRP